MNEKDKNKTAFSAPYGHYEFNRMLEERVGYFPTVDEHRISRHIRDQMSHIFR